MQFPGANQQQQQQQQQASSSGTGGGGRGKGMIEMMEQMMKASLPCHTKHIAALCTWAVIKGTASSLNHS